jgi:hypothetical protein
MHFGQRGVGGPVHRPVCGGTLPVGIDQDNVVSLVGQISADIDGGCRFSAAAFLAAY